MPETPGEPMILRHVRIVPLQDTSGAAPAVVDVRLRDGMVTETGVGLAATATERVLDADGRWLVPGLWDHHVHMLQWAHLVARADMVGVKSAAETLTRLRAHLDSRPDRDGLVIGWGHRSAQWADRPTVADLDAVCGERPVVLISGDAHHAWLSSSALRLLGLPPRDGIVHEVEWFSAYARLGDLPEVRRQGEDAIATVVDRAAALGVVGVTDLEFGSAYRDWMARVGRGITGLRVRAATYPEGLDHVIAAGLRTGAPLDPSAADPRASLMTMGPLKIISDGSLSTRTAFCHQPYLGARSDGDPRGVLNTPPEELRGLLARARAAGLEVAVHAIGDAAVTSALDCFEATGARGSIEHAQLITADDTPRMARLGLTASVQPAHLLDDRDLLDACWADRADRCFPLRSLTDAGVRLVFGSDAPVSPLDPWLEIATAVHRSGDARPPWHPEQALTLSEALAASTNGAGTVGAGSVADLALLDADPLAERDDPAATATGLRAMPVAATLVGGRFTHEQW